ncbi:MAG: DNA polymerase [Candidatus Methylacidiphilales bacterium]
MKTLAIDIETYSSFDLIKSGVYKYVEAPDFSILLLACSFDGKPIELFDLTQPTTDPKIREKSRLVYQALTDPTVLKTAFNANFERTCIAKFFNLVLPPEQWECTMVKASMLGLPLSLDQVAKALQLTEQKDAIGKTLIRYFSLPCKPTKANGERLRNLPEHDLDKWQQFKNYCIQDVKTELAIREKIKFFEIPTTEKKLWCLDQKINDTGLLLDANFVQTAINLSNRNTERLTNEAIRLTSLDNPNSAAQLKVWLSGETGETVISLTKEAIPLLLKNTDCEIVSRVLTIRQEMAKTSVKKYEAMKKGICNDNRVRGLLQFYGANRTGRWAGRLVQVQNLPQNHLIDLDLARTVVASGDLEMLEMLFGNVPDTLSQLIRTAFIAPKEHRFIVADFSAIEARVIAWLAGEKWRLDVFNTHGKIYEASAAQMFKVPIESITKGSPLRQKGKVAELALGYQGGPNALIKMGALKQGLTEEELPKLVAMWRNANKAIVRLWSVVENAAIEAVQEGKAVQIMFGVRFFIEKGILFIELPSKRKLAYLKPNLKPNKFGGLSLTYQGLDQTTKQWGVQITYGGKLVENIVQAIARDCLAEKMLLVDEAGYKLVLHVHDEIVCEEPNSHVRLGEINKLMGEPIQWAKGLPLTADSYETKYYKKD